MVNTGDTYPSEVGSTVLQVMNALRIPNAYRLVYQSKVGPVQWLEPQTDEAIKAFAKNGHKKFLIIPISFVNEHIETLHELDIEYAKELGEKVSNGTPKGFENSSCEAVPSANRLRFLSIPKSAAWRPDSSSAVAERSPGLHSRPGAAGERASGVESAVRWPADGEVPEVSARLVPASPRVAEERKLVVRSMCVASPFLIQTNCITLSY